MIPGSKKTRSRYIPLDVMEKIFLKLPTRSIIKCRGVCKAWRDLSKSRRFALLHPKETDYQSVVQISVNLNNLGKKMGNPQEVAFTLYAELSKQLSHPDHNLSNHNLTWSNRFELGEVSATPFGLGFQLAGNCNGLICIRNDAKTVLINPSMREIKVVPVNFGEGWAQLVGLGFDQLTSDFKVVRMVNTVNQMRARVYSLNTNSWTDVGEIHKSFRIENQTRSNNSCSTFFNGCLHWCVYGTDYSSQILTFNSSTHVSRQMKLPQDVTDKTESRLLVLNQKFLAFLLTTHGSHQVSDRLMNIWVMKEYGAEESWTKLYSITTPPYIREPVSFWEEDKILVGTMAGRLGFYDVSGVPHSGYRATDGLCIGFRVCKESLISLRAVSK